MRCLYVVGACPAGSLAVSVDDGELARFAPFVLAADVGAIATQGLSTNPLSGPRGLRPLEAGLTAEDVRDRLIGETAAKSALEMNASLGCRRPRFRRPSERR
jgi:uncharacterized Ntn-hydrolase superfamily protein